MTACGRVVMVDDDVSVLDAWREVLEIEGLEVSAFADGAKALATLGPSCDAIVLSDVRMPGMSGMDLAAAVRTLDPELPVILMTGHGDIPMAVEAMRKGVWDFLEKPADPVHLIETSRRALDYRRLVLENRHLRQAKDGATWATRLIGDSRQMQALRQRLERVAAASADVLVHGQTGTGKEVVARALHDFGNRKGRFVAINCGAIPESMIEAELFGHEAGAFTNANERRIGQVEYASGGTLFLDEIESMPLVAQVRMLRVLQERRIVRLGSNAERPVDIRVIAATKADLHALAAEGRFRADLAFRLDIARIELPPLAQRRDDILPLFEHFLRLAALREGIAPPSIPAALARDLEGRDWPGNVRELRNVAERFCLGLEDVPDMPVAVDFGDDRRLDVQMDRFEATLIADALARNSGRIGETAAMLGISRKTLYLKMRRHALSAADATP
ncbi:sigma-54-dependent transcriptional regulator [Aureimonas frigidaquae]|uniref:Two component, sigma-54 specific, transcriptional regulator, Fis family n=1 Tax=Aureimonas frigidaquae TaxID=424757 RepID=A0A0P0Z394_9HYPH|nr:sigma-54 dependent transcriptional regulator [Aureimonas frigidaquae]BAT28564.1 two component, sigma-54 specific, transcriptional regulator, Fis family [Aureimonas frigidaquae]